MSNPVTAVFPLSSDLNGTGQSGALALTGVAPIRYDSGLWLEESTTNYNPNPEFYSDVDFWSSFGKGSGIDASFGWSAGRARWTVTSVDISGGTHMYMGRDTGIGSFSPGEPCTISAIVTGSGMTGTMVLVVFPHDSSWSGIAPDKRSSVVPLDGANYLLSCTIPSLPAGTSGVWVYVQTEFSANGGSGAVDCLWYQIEKKTYATSICPELDGSGVPNAGYAFTGTAHESTSTRAASSASISPSGILSPASGSLAFRITPTIETGVEEIWGECGSKGVGTDSLRWGRDASKHPFVEWSSNDAAYTRVTLPGTVEAGDEHFYSIEWSTGDNYLGIYRDREEYEYGVPSAPSGSFGAGDITLKATAGGVIYRNFLAADRPLTDAERFILFSVDTWTMDTIGPGYETSGGWGSPTDHGGSDGGASWGMQNLSVIAHPDDDRVRR